MFTCGDRKGARRYLSAMPIVATDAIVLHAFDYSETSRILRLATRDAGVQSVLARGARRSQKRFGSALDLFAEGAAQLVVKDGRELNTLAAFDVTRARPALGADLGRFTSASALAELVLRFVVADAGPTLFATLAEALDDIAAAAPAVAREAGLAGAWRLVAQLGFAPSLVACSACHVTLEASDELTFSHEAGGALCPGCARFHPSGRILPAEARARVAAWIDARALEPLDELTGRAHQRLLREFLRYHLADGRSLRAFDVWEHGRWSAS